nr:hypothetical protein [Fredinandcohnia onubensis]
MTHRISSLTCFSVPWKRRSLFLRARTSAHVLTDTIRYSKLRRLELLGPFQPPFEL